MKWTKRVIFLLFTVTGALYSNSATGALKPQTFFQPSQTEIRQGASSMEDLRTGNFMLGLSPKEIDAVRKKEQEVIEAFDGFTEKEINYKPLIRPIASMDTITLHPYFTFSLLLPRGSVITHADTSSNMAVLKYEQNTIMLRPNSDFKVANITIIYNLKEENKILNILATRYEKNGDNKLNLVYSYSDTPKLSASTVLETYIRETNSFPTEEYSYININDISYRIVEDRKNGTVFLPNGKAYRVDNNTIFK